MAGNNAATKAFFKSGYGIVLAVYDTRRGQQEGREAEKILAFYPPTAPAIMQSSIVGLAQALTMFAGTFNKECPFHTMTAQQHQWALYHAEPDLWLLVVVGRHLSCTHTAPDSLAGLLKGLHGLTVLLHGLLGTQLEQDPSGGRVRLRLQPLLQDIASSLLQPDSPALFSLSSPLGLTGGVPLLQVSTAAFTRVQSLANSLLVSRLFGCRPVSGVLLAWHSCLLWSSSSSSDTAALHALLVRGLEPAAREGPKHKTWRRPGGTPLPQQQQQQQQQVQSSSGTPQLPQSTRSSSSLGSSGSIAAPAAGGSSGGAAGSSSSSSLTADMLCLAVAASWCCRPDGLLLPVWCAEGAGSSGSSVGGGQQQQQQQQLGDGSNGCSELPLVWLQSGSEPARLLAWHSGPLLVLLLLEPQGPAAAAASCASVTASLLSMLAAPAAALAAQLSAELPAKHLWHVKGLRYLYQDHLAAAVRASPRRKVFTLSAASLRVTADARQAAALEATAAADPTAVPLGPTTSPPAAAGTAPGSAAAAAAGSATQGGNGSDGGASGAAGSSSDGSSDGSSKARVLGEAWESFAAGGDDADVEVVVKGANDSWVVCRHTGSGRQLTAVVESEKEGLTGVMRKVQAFCDTQCPGVFEGIS